MNSTDLPVISEVRSYYGINFDKYAILIFHPVTTEIKDIRRQVSILIDAVIATKDNFVVLYPNNDHGTDFILDEYRRLHGLSNVVIYPSMRFEYFLTLMRHADYILGNSSSGIREAPHFGVPTINLGSRQNNRVKTATVLNVDITKEGIMDAIHSVKFIKRIPVEIFGHGDSAESFYTIMLDSHLWDGEIQKYFVDYL
jgi:UDP-N-acetylglucosamine 2-epimerase (hydrolysing)